MSNLIDDLSREHAKRRKTRSILCRCRRFANRHTWTIPLVLLFAFLSLYAINPTQSNMIHRFLFLSYGMQESAASTTDTSPSASLQYAKGPRDIAFVSFYMVLLSFTREFIMQELLRPLARYYGIRSRGKQQRFMEQMYMAIYFGFMGPFGLYVMRRTPVWYFNTAGMYESFPHKTLSGDFKFYYLFQAAYWAQQALVMLLGLEAKRKDFRELVAHHIVTLSLIALSYRFHFTYMGIAVYLTHDISDFVLAISKSLNYIQSPLQGPAFATCISAWIYLRNYQNLRIIISLLTEFQTVGSYELNWETQQYKCWISNIITFGLLTALQALNVFWLYCLLRSAFRFVVYKVAKDDRSDAEESGPEGPEADKPKVEKVEAQRLLHGRRSASGSASGLVKATGNGKAAFEELYRIKLGVAAG